MQHHHHLVQGGEGVAEHVQRAQLCAVLQRRQCAEAVAGCVQMLKMLQGGYAVKRCERVEAEVERVQSVERNETQGGGELVVGEGEVLQVWHLTT